MKIKVYDCSHEKDLEEQLNSLVLDLKENNQEIIDIKYSTSCSCDGTNEFYIYSALVMYDDKENKKYIPKRYELIEKEGIGNE